MNSILQIIGNVNRAGGGPPRSVSSLCDALADQGLKVALATQITKGDPISDLILPKNPLVHISIAKAITVPKLRLIYSPSFYRLLSEQVQKFRYNIIHSHSLWLPCNNAASKISTNFKIPHVISPRGTLSPWAFEYRSWKKKPVWTLWQKKALLRAVAFCATSFKEAENIREMGFNQPIAIIPNGIDPFQFRPSFHSKTSSHKKVLFLSRIHPVKGVCELVKAWSQIRPEGWKIVLAGPDEEGHLARVKELIREYNLASDFEITGPVVGTEKEKLFHEADLFILPSYTENFGIVIAEALSAGLPVITTKGTPWESLVTHRCGWWIDIGVDSLANAIKNATKLSLNELRQMGERGREYIEKEFLWSSIAMKTAKFYSWILGQGEMPDFIFD